MTEQMTKEPISARDTIRQTRIQKLTELKDVLLPKLMTGDIN